MRQNGGYVFFWRKKRVMGLPALVMSAAPTGYFWHSDKDMSAAPTGYLGFRTGTCRLRRRVILAFGQGPVGCADGLFGPLAHFSTDY